MMRVTGQLVDEIEVLPANITTSASSLTNQLQPAAVGGLGEESMAQANVVDDLIENGTLTATEDPTNVPERLRLRTGKKPSYAEDVGEDDMDWESDDARDTDEEQPPIKKKKKQRADSCSVCGLGDKLINCSTCPAAYHLGCLNPPLKVAPRGRWRCPQCADPFAEIEKLLDCQMRVWKGPSTYPEGEATADPSSELLTRQYLVKWKSRSYLHCSWISEVDLERSAKAYAGLKIRLNNFRRQMDSMRNFNALEDDWAPLRSEWTTVQKVLDSRQTGNVKEYLVKWKELGYEDISWEVEEDIATFEGQIDRFKAIKARSAVNIPKKRKRSTHESREARKKRKDFTALEETPKYLTGGVLHPYQLEGLNFLRFAWQQGKHVILADEMGLGKTIQSIAFLASLMDEGIPSPHLVVAPLSTLRNWEREFSTWAPHMNTVMYFGSAPARTIIREHEFYFPKAKGPIKKKKQKKKPISVKQSKQERIKFDVLLTSYEMINIDTTILKSFKWECLIVDEGHRLKNKDSKLFQTLHQYVTRHRALLTGTPLQNNLDELFMLMHFLDAGKFASLEEFQQTFRDLNQEEQVGRLHKMLAPHLLRRVKKDVMKELPPKKELIVRVELSALQKEYYKAILTRNYQLLSRRGGAQICLNNVVMELRKLCGHPYLLEGVEEEMKRAPEPHRQLVEASGKLLLLDKLMVKLKADGHRVLIYSQFKIMLDILEDWLSFKKWIYERIDGSISGAERQIRIDRFNAPASTRFCFLLSTRAGGLGINLATADTVIIYDSDWNPHADLQAMARAHRLGQTNKVMIYRLITRGSIEERMMQLTKKKMVLEHLVVGRLKTHQVLNQEELDDILRYGAKELFADENDETKKSQQIHYDDAAIDRLLDRSQIETEEEAAPDEEDNDPLKAFKVANFEYVDEEEAAKEMEGKQDSKVLESEAKAQYWDDLLKQRFEEQQQRDAAAELGKGKRARKQFQVLSLGEDDLAGMASVSSDDEEDEPTTETVGTQASMILKEVGEGAEKKLQVHKKKSKVEPAEPPGPPPLLQGEGKLLKTLGFNRKQRATFVQILMRFGLGDFSWSEFIPRMKPKTAEEIKEYGTLFLTHIAEDISDSPTFADGVPKEGLRIQDVLVRLAVLHLIQDKVKEFIEGSIVPLFPDDVYKRIPALVNTRFWKEPHDCKLLQAILKHGYGRWQEIVDDAESEIKGIVCKELQLPSAVGGSSGMDDTKPFLQDDSLQSAGQSDTGTSLLSADKQEDFSAGSACSKDTQNQRMHKRMVEFLKKRVGVLEKALNAEYHQESMEDQKGEEESTKDASVIETQGTGANSQAELLQFQSSILILLAPEEISVHANDNESRRLEVARIYNEMCKLVNESEADAAETYTGNKAAGIRLRKNSRQIDGLCIDMRKTFVTTHAAGSAPAERGIIDQSSFGTNKNTVLREDVDVLSDEHDEDIDPELDSDYETPTTFSGLHKLETCESSEQQQKILENVFSLHSPEMDLRGTTHSLLVGNKDTISVSSFSTFQSSNLPRQSPTVVVLDD